MGGDARTLHHIAEVIMGQSPPGEAVTASRHGLPLLNGPSEFTASHPIPTQFTTDVRKKAHAGDILFCVRGSTTGRMNWADQDYAIGRGIAAIRPRVSGTTPAIRGILEIFLPSLLSGATGSTFPNVSRDQLKDLPVPRFSPAELLIVSEVLGDLDDKIELNRHMARTLEAMARALFKSWFVDFDPVCAKAEGRDPGFSPDTAALFPDRFGDNGLPEGWREGTLEDVTTLNPNNRSSASSHEAINYVDLANTKWGVIEDIQRFAPQDAPSRAQRVLLAGDTIVGTVRPGNGSYALISKDGLIGSTGFAVLRPKAKQFREFAYLAATSRVSIEALASLADGGAYPAVRPNLVAETPCHMPSDEVMKAFHLAVSALMDRLDAARRESQTLAALRGALLPKLISGELRIRDAAAEVSAA